MPFLTSGRSRFIGGGRVPPTPVPVAGAELIVNGDFATGDYTGWTPAGTLTASVTDGVVEIVAPADSGRGLTQANIAAADTWVIATCSAMAPSANTVVNGAVMALHNAPVVSDNQSAQVSAEDVTQSLFFSGLTTSARRSIWLMVLNRNVAWGAAGDKAYFDNVSLKAYAIASLISVRPYASADCDISVAITRTAGTQAGFAVRVDDPANPQNFIISYLDGAGNLKTDKCVAGTYTAIAGLTGAITYVAGQRPRILCAGNDVSVYYNGVQVGSTTAISDAGIVSNKNHGLFSTYVGNTFTSYTAA